MRVRGGRDVGSSAPLDLAGGERRSFLSLTSCQGAPPHPQRPAPARPAPAVARRLRNRGAGEGVAVTACQPGRGPNQRRGSRPKQRRSPRVAPGSPWGIGAGGAGWWPPEPEWLPALGGRIAELNDPGTSWDKLMWGKNSRFSNTSYLLYMCPLGTLC